MLRARLLLSRVFVSCSCVDLDMIGSRLDRIIHGTPCFPFYRPRESMGYSGGKEKNEREKKVFRIAGSFFSFMRVLPIL